MAEPQTNHLKLHLKSSTKAAPVVIDNLHVASDLLSRTVGLLGHSSLPANEGLWIHRCNSIHMFFMRFAIDAVFVDRQLQVRKTYSGLKPWRMTFPIWGADSVFELPVGTIAKMNIEIGDQLHVGH